MFVPHVVILDGSPDKIKTWDLQALVTHINLVSVGKMFQNTKNALVFDSVDDFCSLFQNDL